ncbi:hypothetical protein CEXT_188931 [Caerostris extrusa]|uniref:Uncharacterized protein n=1 Tax=Caerostris extrusa TaxID=172846 RepID=A0AAV4NP33_CAEEX|nr:hypothetical protein CEXT_188931 [Caerostris extrusa]
MTSKETTIPLSPPSPQAWVERPYLWGGGGSISSAEGYVGHVTADRAPSGRSRRHSWKRPKRVDPVSSGDFRNRLTPVWAN